MKAVVIVGGRSGEHDVSLETGRAMAEAAVAAGHVVETLVFRRDGGTLWRGREGSLADGVAALQREAPDVALIGMHGPDGEDGKIQALLELLDIPYQGSDVAASAVCMDKARTKAVYRSHALPVADDVVLWPGEAADWDAIAGRLGLPLVLKTAESGSSVGVEVVDTIASFASSASRLLASSLNLVVERWLPGAEYTASVLEEPDGSLTALPIVEIRPLTARFFDYEAKYTPGATDEICPAPISAALATELQDLGLRSHVALGCRHYSRTDFKLDAAGDVFVLETNTLPGLTPASLFPKASAAAGLTFPELIDRLAELARRG